MQRHLHLNSLICVLCMACYLSLLVWCSSIRYMRGLSITILGCCKRQCFPGNSSNLNACDGLIAYNVRSNMRYRHITIHQSHPTPLNLSPPLLLPSTYAGSRDLYVYAIIRWYHSKHSVLLNQSFTYKTLPPLSSHCQACSWVERTVVLISCQASVNTMEERCDRVHISE